MQMKNKDIDARNNDKELVLGFIEKSKKGDLTALGEVMSRFSECISWEQIDWFFETYLTKEDRKRFDEWCLGQTCPLGGMYKWDLAQFFKGLKSFD